MVTTLPTSFYGPKCNNMMWDEYQLTRTVRATRRRIGIQPAWRANRGSTIIDPPNCPLRRARTVVVRLVVFVTVIINQ